MKVEKLAADDYVRVPAAKYRALLEQLAEQSTPELWMKWCDSRALDRIESLQVDVATMRSRCELLLGVIDAREAQIAAVEADAKRYRWLVTCNDGGVWTFLSGLDDDQIDEAIDKWIADDSAAPAGGQCKHEWRPYGLDSLGVPTLLYCWKCSATDSISPAGALQPDQSDAAK